MHKLSKIAARESGASTLKTDRSLPIALIRAREKVMGPVRAMLLDLGLTEQQWRVLRVLEESGPTDVSKLASQACLLLPSMTRIVQTLDEKNLVTRETHQYDRRRQVIRISRAGLQLVQGNMAEAQRLAGRVEKALGARKLNTLLDLLKELDKLELEED